MRLKQYQNSFKYEWPDHCICLMLISLGNWSRFYFFLRSNNDFELSFIILKRNFNALFFLTGLKCLINFITWYVTSLDQNHQIVFTDPLSTFALTRLKHKKLFKTHTIMILFFIPFQSIHGFYSSYLHHIFLNLIWSVVADLVSFSFHFYEIFLCSSILAWIKIIDSSSGCVVWAGSLLIENRSSNFLLTSQL